MSPTFSGHEEEGIHKLIEKAIQGCEAATQETMWSNIVLSGGVCQFPGNNLRVNSDKVQNVGQGQNLDHLRTPLI